MKLKASEYIKMLQELIDKHGDLEVISMCDDQYYNNYYINGPKYVNTENCREFSHDALCGAPEGMEEAFILND